MVTRIFLDKSTTIKKDNKDNFGLNPICQLEYGVSVDRSLIHFNIDKLIERVEDKTYYDTDKLKHVLKFKNCGNIDGGVINKEMVGSNINGVKQRASSFDIIVFKLNKHWDEGVGFDNTNDLWVSGKGAVSEYGATWYNATTEELWDEDGIYDDDFLYRQYEMYKSGSKNTIIIGSQHFDHGNEDFEIDITDYVNDLISGIEENYGLCIAFSPILEQGSEKVSQYVGFFNNKTNTIFEPVLETRYNLEINDSRMRFYLGKENKLYLYSYIGGKLENLDELPTCFIGEDEYLPYQDSKGIYHIEVKYGSKEYSKDTILHDVWGNLLYEGDEIDDVELDFVTKSANKYFEVSNETVEPKILNPFIVGIKDNEIVSRDEVRSMKIFFREPYTHNDFQVIDECYYRIYAKEGNREITIIDWDETMNMDRCNYFTLDMSEFVPTQYHVDIKVRFGNDVRVFKDELMFKIQNDTTKQNI